MKHIINLLGGYTKEDILNGLEDIMGDGLGIITIKMKDGEETSMSMRTFKEIFLNQLKQ